MFPDDQWYRLHTALSNNNTVWTLTKTTNVIKIGIMVSKCKLLYFSIIDENLRKISRFVPKKNCNFITKLHFGQFQWDLNSYQQMNPQIHIEHQERVLLQKNKFSWEWLNWFGSHFHQLYKKAYSLIPWFKILVSLIILTKNHKHKRVAFFGVTRYPGTV